MAEAAAETKNSRLSTVVGSVDDLVGAHVDTLADLFLRGRPPSAEALPKLLPGKFLNFAGSRAAHLLLRPATRLLSERVLSWNGIVLDHGGERGANRFGDREAVRFRVVAGASLLDAGPALLLLYGEAPWPLSLLRDELRVVAPGVALGPTYFGDALVGWFGLRV